MNPYYADDSVTLWHGDMREIVPTLDVHPDCVIADPPYGETSLAWDRWPAGWPTVLADAADERYCEVIARRLAQDVLPIGGPP